MCFSIDAVINDEHQARECLNIMNKTINPPSPVILEATIEDKFICETKPLLYSFSCTLYGYDLIWYFNNETVTVFHPNDMTGDKVSKSYPESAPVYNITAVLTQISTETVSRYNAPFCVSILTVQPFNENRIEVMPFTVSCQTHCENGNTTLNSTSVCQTEHYEVAGIYFN